MPETLELIQESGALAEAPNVARSITDVARLLDGVTGLEVLSLDKGDNIFVQGGRSDSVYFVKRGKVKVTVVSDDGREALLTLLNAPSFVGEECLAGQSLRSSTATALEPSTVFRVRKQAMLQSVHTRPELRATFVTSLLSRGNDLEDDLCNQLFNISEKRLAWILIKLAQLNTHDTAASARIPWLSHETLAEMVGTTRSRICRFMKKFKSLNMIEYHGSREITIRTKMLTDLVLNDR